MKKLIIILVIIMLASTVACNRTKVLKDDNWQSIKDSQYSNYEVWAGCGLYFYEENNTPYCQYMVYGSGVRVMTEYFLKVKIDNDGNLYFSLPENVILQQLIECSDSDEMVDYIITITEDAVIVDGITFNKDDDIMTE